MLEIGVRVLEIKLVKTGQGPYCQWCGHKKTPGSMHGDIDVKGEIATVRCSVLQFDLPLRMEGHE